MITRAKEILDEELQSHAAHDSVHPQVRESNHTVTHACTEADTLRSTPPPLHGSSSPLVNTMLEKADRRSPGNPVVAFGDAIRRIQRSI